MSKKLMIMLLALLFICLASFRSVSLDFPCTAHAFFPERLSNHCQNVMPFLCRIHREITSGQIKGRKNMHLHPAA
jgi:hypothetical protein